MASSRSTANSASVMRPASTKGPMRTIRCKASPGTVSVTASVRPRRSVAARSLFSVRVRWICEPRRVATSKPVLPTRARMRPKGFSEESRIVRAPLRPRRQNAKTVWSSAELESTRHLLPSWSKRCEEACLPTGEASLLDGKQCMTRKTGTRAASSTEICAGVGCGSKRGTSSEHSHSSGTTRPGQRKEPPCCASGWAACGPGGERTTESMLCTGVGSGSGLVPGTLDAASGVKRRAGGVPGDCVCNIVRRQAGSMFGNITARGPCLAAAGAKAA
mmetsp:Transcript_31898/g.99241  ORF Transcript_31898/g.99241 Transcript_31898/m.99241 type:complete len:275 (-) Transcript_31898:356-1180(-)